MQLTHFSSFTRHTIIVVLCTMLIGCNSYISSSVNNVACQSNCKIGSGVQGVDIFVEPDAGYHIITDAINNAKRSVWLEMYLLTERHVINALQEAAHRGIDVRVMLEEHPYGGGSISPIQTLDRLKAAKVNAKTTSPHFALSHAKMMLIDANTVYIMTANFTSAGLGGSRTAKNREYGIIDTHMQDVQAIIDIFNADWNRTEAHFNNPNLVVSPVNARAAFTSLINSTQKTLLIEAELMRDNGIVQALVDAAKRGVNVRAILPARRSSSGINNNDGIRTIKQGGVQIRELSQLYMHAKIIVADGQRAFLGSENISTASLERNRELGIIVSDQKVLDTLQQTFWHDWNTSQLGPQ